MGRTWHFDLRCPINRLARDRHKHGGNTGNRARRPQRNSRPTEKSGKISRNSRIRLFRDDVEIHEGTLTSLRRFKEDAKEVATGFECGLQIHNCNDVREGDIIEVFEIGERKRTLEGN